MNETMQELKNIQVQEVLEYQGSRADKTFRLTTSGDVKALRMHYLKHKRDDWDWIDHDSSEPNPYVIIKEQ